MARKWVTLAVVNVAVFMLLLDITVVNTALPSIREDLDASFTDLQWVIDAYALTLAAFVLAAGSLADRLGRRRVFAWGIGIFTLASGAAALAPDPTWLNLSRAVQGIGGAVMFAVSLALIAQEFKGKELGMAMGLYGATIGTAVAIGPLVGGALTDWIGWESVFAINVPIGVVAVVLTYLRVAESRDPAARGVDWAGVGTFSTSLFLLVLALLRGNEEGWGSALIVGLFAGAAALFAAFVAVEARQENPMLPLRLFRIPAFTGVQLAAFAVSGSLFALFLYLTLYMQNILGLSPLEAGVRYLPLTIVSFVVAPIAGVLLAKLPARAMLSVGLLMAGVGMLLMAGVEQGDEWTGLLGGFLVAGAGVGLVNPVIAHVAVSVVPPEQSGMASGINDTFRQVGIAVGIAAYGALFLGRSESEISELAAGTPAVVGDTPRELSEAVSSGGLDGALQALPVGSRDTVANAAREGFLAGFNEIMLIGAGLAIAGAIASLVLVRPRDIRDAPEFAEVEPVTVPAAA
jgi:EmrB/QacA subfamily drug resistance transporter